MSITNVCARCGAVIVLMPHGEHYKWQTNLLDSNSWHCGNDPEHPVLGHFPSDLTRPRTFIEDADEWADAVASGIIENGGYVPPDTPILLRSPRPPDEEGDELN